MAEKKETTLRSALLQKILLAVIAGIGWYALSLQFYLMVQNSEANNMTVTRSVTNFFSYFTILSNLLHHSQQLTGGCQHYRQVAFANQQHRTFLFRHPHLLGHLFIHHHRRYHLQHCPPPHLEPAGTAINCRPLAA